ncbi:NifB/NifX family molybdenum-iron cluster-binding protein [Calothrix sp. UHCC 0171]|uniref:NifB/NifX family molybdenum-iron cluster-binding protein n=1 Tax=Calothrix sp. UHCC 0171 TaxID=3110245 RepID=UPI002B21F457|nr:NifB/NifX family molybdenum-iron cluster-binding protein [Calothrix sp. UHCC 0171]MEA5574517.1 NifB/NifX family molybdenum-iron cluster-binding protein [Calothrix sp. UHCC 0171]
MKVAFTTSDGTHVDVNFDPAKTIDVYEVTKDGFNFVETLTFEEDSKEAFQEGKLTPKMEAVLDCKIIYLKAVSKPVGNTLMKQGVTLVRVQEYDTVPEILYALVKSINGTAPPMLRKVIEAEREKVANS